MFSPEKIVCVCTCNNFMPILISLFIFTRSCSDLPRASLSDLLSPTQISSPSSGNLSQLKLSGHVKSTRFVNASQPCLALLQRWRQGGTGVAKTVQIGAYAEQRKYFKSSEQHIFIKGQNCFSSRAASSCVVCLNMFGNNVVLYGRPLQKGMVIDSHGFSRLTQGNTKLSPKIRPGTRKRTMFAPKTAVHISARISSKVTRFRSRNVVLYQAFDYRNRIGSCQSKNTWLVTLLAQQAVQQTNLALVRHGLGEELVFTFPYITHICWGQFSSLGDLYLFKVICREFQNGIWINSRTE